MLTYVRRRLLLAVPVVLGVSVVVFSIVHLLPGDPVLAILSGANATAEQEPLPVQYLRFLGRAPARRLRPVHLLEAPRRGGDR